MERDTAKKTLLILVPALLGSAPQAQATATGIGSEAGILYEGILVSCQVAPTQFNSFDEPLNGSGCVVDSSDVVAQFSTIYATNPTFVTITYRSPDDVWAIADCMSTITNYLHYNYPGTKVLIDLAALFNSEQSQEDSGLHVLHPDHVSRAADWYGRVLANYTYFSASEVLGIIIHQESTLEWTNVEMNLSIRDGTNLWTAGPNWSAVDTVAGFGLNSQSFPRTNYELPWRLEVAVMYDYPTFNPNKPTHLLNMGEFFDLIDTFEAHVNDHGAQKVALNVRGFLLPSHRSAGWDAEKVRLSQLACCRWAYSQTRLDIIWTGLWTWRDHELENGATLDGLAHLISELGDPDLDGTPDLVEQTERYFELARGLSNNCATN